jgi:hypothetical protein
MRPINELNNEEKAVLLHQLLPGEIQRFLSHLQSFALMTVHDAEEVKQNWKRKRIMINAEQWIAFAQQVADCIKAQRKELTKNPEVFARELFRGGVMIFTVNYIPVYCGTCPYRFRDGVKFLFDLKPSTKLPFQDDEL